MMSHGQRVGLDSISVVYRIQWPCWRGGNLAVCNVSLITKIAIDAQVFCFNALCSQIPRTQSAFVTNGQKRISGGQNLSMIFVNSICLICETISVSDAVKSCVL